MKKQEKIKKEFLEDLTKTPVSVLEETLPVLIPLYKYGGLFCAGCYFAEKDVGGLIASGVCSLIGFAADKLYNLKYNKMTKEQIK